MATGSTGHNEEMILARAAAAQAESAVLRDEAQRVRSLRRELQELRAVAQQLEKAIDTRDVIGQAKGVLMERHKIDADAAFDLLRKTSQHLNIKLIEVAGHLARTGELLQPTLR